MQLDLPYQKHSPTSRAAAASIDNAASLRARVYRLIEERESWGATDIEIQNELNMDGNTERPRRRELQRAGKIKDSGRTRKTPSGRSAVVWVVNG